MTAAARPVSSLRQARHALSGGFVRKRPRRWATMLAIGALGGLLVTLLRPSLLAPHSAEVIDLSHMLAAPSLHYPLGTDGFGRCVLSRVIYGARPSIAGALVVAFGSMAIALAVAVASTARARVVNTVARRLTDAALSLPTLVVAIATVGILGAGTAPAVVALCTTMWAGPSRIFTVLVLGERASAHVEAARSMGASPWWMLRTHLLPAVASRMLVVGSQLVVSALLTLSGLSVLGLGPQPPSPEWGAMLNEARQWFYASPWLIVAPGAAIAMVAVTVTTLSDRIVSRLGR